MSLRAQEIGPVPADTARVARVPFPKGNHLHCLRDELGTIYDDAWFAALFPATGRPAEAPWRLALSFGYAPLDEAQPWMACWRNDICTLESLQRSPLGAASQI